MKTLEFFWCLLLTDGEENMGKKVEEERLMDISWMNDGWVREILKHRNDGIKSKPNRKQSESAHKTECGRKRKRKIFNQTSIFINQWIRYDPHLISRYQSGGVCVINQSLFGGR